MTSNNRKAGPTGPVAGHFRAIEQAQTDRARPDEIPGLLAALRRRDQGAKEAMSQKFMYTVYEKALAREGRLCTSKFASLFIGLSTAIDRLAKNDESNAEKFITDELSRSKRDRAHE